MLVVNSKLSHLYLISNINSCKRSASSDLGIHCSPRSYLWNVMRI